MKNFTKEQLIKIIMMLQEENRNLRLELEGQDELVNECFNDLQHLINELKKYE